MADLGKIKSSVEASKKQADLKKRLDLLTDDIVTLIDLLANFTLVNKDTGSGAKCLYHSGTSDSDDVALEKVAEMGSALMAGWTIGPPGGSKK